MRWALALLLPMLLSCASTPSAKHAPSPERPLVAPSSLGAERTVSQIVRGAVGTREMTLNCVVTVKGGEMTVVGLNAMGIRLFTVRHDGQAAHAEQGLPIPEQLTPERLLADLQFVFWPVDALRAPFAQSGWEISDAAGTRRLRRDGRLVAEAHYASDDPWTGRSWLVNFEYGYSMQIDSKAM